MAFTSVVALLLLCVVAVQCKTYTKCGLATKLVGLGVSRSSVHHWVCMAGAESSFDTTATHVNSGGSSTDYGIFQINSYWNCDDGTSNKNGCGHPCSDYLDNNLSDDIQCINQLLREHHGWGFSYGYGSQCSSVSSSYLNGCNY